MYLIPPLYRAHGFVMFIFRIFSQKEIFKGLFTTHPGSLLPPDTNSYVLPYYVTSTIHQQVPEENRSPIILKTIS
jgi:hypothetical protein